MKLPERKEGQERGVAVSGGIHPIGEFVFQVQDEVTFNYNTEKTYGPSMTYQLRFKSMEAINGTKDAGVGKIIFSGPVNVSYHNVDGFQVNESGLKTMGFLLISTGIANDGDDLPLNEEQYAANLQMELPNKVFAGKVIHVKEKVREKNDDGEYVETGEVRPKAVIAEYWSVSGNGGGSTVSDSAALAQAALEDDVPY